MQNPFSVLNNLYVTNAGNIRSLENNNDLLALEIKKRRIEENNRNDFLQKTFPLRRQIREGNNLINKFYKQARGLEGEERKEKFLLAKNTKGKIKDLQEQIKKYAIKYNIR